MIVFEQVFATKWIDAFIVAWAFCKRDSLSNLSIPDSCPNLSMIRPFSWLIWYLIWPFLSYLWDLNKLRRYDFGHFETPQTQKFDDPLSVDFTLPGSTLKFREPESILLWGDFWFFKHLKVIENRRLDLVLLCLDRLLDYSNSIT